MKRRARVVAGALHAVSITALAAGASVLFLMSMAASLNEYGRVSLVDGSWLGPLPWPTVGVGLTLFGATLTVAAPFHVEGVDKVPPKRAPAVGQHSDEILREVGYSADEISRLRKAGVLA